MQAAVKRGVAYDLSRFDNRRIVREQISKEKTAAKSKSAVKTKTRSVVSGFAVFSYIMCMGLLVVTLFSYVTLNEVSDKNMIMQKKLDKLREETQMFEINKTQKFGSEQIKDYAVNVLGMKKLNKSQITYINLEQADKAEIIHKNEMLADKSKLVAGIAYGFDRIVEYIN